MTTRRQADTRRRSLTGALYGVVLLLAACSPSTGGQQTTTTQVVADTPDTGAVRVEVEPEQEDVPPATTATTVPGWWQTAEGRRPAGEGPNSEEAFIELREEEGGRLVRWNRRELTVALAGSPTDTDRYTLEGFVRTIAGIPGVPGLLVTETGAADIVIHFLPRSQWGQVAGDGPVGDDVDGQARYFQSGGEITEVAIVVDTASSQLQRNRTLVHEMLHAYGPGHHSCRGGLLHGGSDYDPRWDLSEYDSLLLAAWYAEHPGEPKVGIDLPCPAVEWDTVLFQGETLWCRLESTECYPVDARRGVVVANGPSGWYSGGSITTYDPARYVAFASQDGRVLCELGEGGYRDCELGATRTVGRPNRWYDGTSLYDYDPSTHLVRRFEGRRLLCEIPDGKRAPCQFTDGFELTGTDLYTDGEFVFETP